MPASRAVGVMPMPDTGRVCEEVAVYEIAGGWGYVDADGAVLVTCR